MLTELLDALKAAALNAGARDMEATVNPTYDRANVQIHYDAVADAEKAVLAAYAGVVALSEELQEEVARLKNKSTYYSAEDNRKIIKMESELAGVVAERDQLQAQHGDSQNEIHELRVACEARADERDCETERVMQFQSELAAANQSAEQSARAYQDVGEELFKLQAAYKALGDATIQELGEETVGDKAILEIARLGQELAAAKAENVECDRINYEHHEHCRKLENENERLREAIRAVPSDYHDACPFCRAILPLNTAEYEINHRADCIWLQVKKPEEGKNE